MENVGGVGAPQPLQRTRHHPLNDFNLAIGRGPPNIEMEPQSFSQSEN